MILYKFVKDKRMAARLTQPELAEKAGVGLRFVRDLEQGKTTLRLDKVNQVLQLFGYQLGPVEVKRGDITDSANTSVLFDPDVNRKGKKS